MEKAELDYDELAVTGEFVVGYCAECGLPVKLNESIDENFHGKVSRRHIRCFKKIFMGRRAEE